MPGRGASAAVAGRAATGPVTSASPSALDWIPGNHLSRSTLRYFTLACVARGGKRISRAFNQRVNVGGARGRPAQGFPGRSADPEAPVGEADETPQRHHDRAEPDPRHEGI